LDLPVERSGGGYYDPGLEPRVSRLEVDLRDMKTTLDDLRTMVARIDAQIPYLATKADLADKPGKAYMWGILAALLTAYACGLAALAVLK
jgi:gamma-glutamyl:cysteine ligase YbdK (ATP-grasp superfamily)